MLWQVKSPKIVMCSGIRYNSVANIKYKYSRMCKSSLKFKSDSDLFTRAFSKMLWHYSEIYTTMAFVTRVKIL